MKNKTMKAAALSLVVPTIMSFSGCAKKDEKPKVQNKVGYVDINPYFNTDFSKCCISLTCCIINISS